MSKKTVQKATFKDLIAKKLQKEKEQFKSKEIYISAMDRFLTFVKPKEEILIDIMDNISEENTMSENLEMTRKLIYHSCPMLQDVELHNELGIQDPYDVVKEIFDLADITEIGAELNTLVGFEDKAEELKK